MTKLDWWASDLITLMHFQMSVFSVYCQEMIVWYGIIQKILTIEVKYHEILYLSGLQKEPKVAKIFWKLSVFCMMLVARYKQATYRICWHAFFDNFWPLLPNISGFCMMLVHSKEQASYRNHWHLVKTQGILYDAYLYTYFQQHTESTYIPLKFTQN